MAIFPSLIRRRYRVIGGVATSPAVTALWTTRASRPSNYSFSRSFFTRRVYRKRPSTAAPSDDLRLNRHGKIHRADVATTIGGALAQERKVRPELNRFLNPWRDLADVVSDGRVLSDRVDSVTRTFGVVAAVMSSLSAALIIAGGEYSSSRPRRELSGLAAPSHVPASEAKPPMSEEVEGKRLTADDDAGDDSTKRAQDDGTDRSILLSWGLTNHEQLHNIYTACCAGSFYGSVSAMGLSAVINAWLAATPPGGVRSFVRSQSVYICTVPGLLGLSTGLAGTALFIGLDRSKGPPISYIGLGGTMMGGLLIGSAAIRGWLSTYRSLTQLAKKL